MRKTKLIFALWLLSGIATPLDGAKLDCQELSALAKVMGLIIAEDPVDAMGADFRKVFGNFVARHEANIDNMMDLAISAFQERLDLAMKYQTEFANQMLAEPGKPVWSERIKGESTADCYSFGARFHFRADKIWQHLNQMRSRYNSHRETIDTARLPFFLGRKAPANQRMAGEVWDFPLPEGELTTVDAVFKIIRLSENEFYIQHANGKFVPRLLEILGRLWRESLDPEFKGNRLEALAKFEWIWFWTNPFGRAGALTGDVLSLLAQRRLAAMGYAINFRDTFTNQDLEALSRSYPDYIMWRIHDLGSSKPPGSLSPF